MRAVPCGPEHAGSVSGFTPIELAYLSLTLDASTSCLSNADNRYLPLPSSIGRELPYKTPKVRKQPYCTMTGLGVVLSPALNNWYRTLQCLMSGSYHRKGLCQDFPDSVGPSVCNMSKISGVWRKHFRHLYDRNNSNNLINAYHYTVIQRRILYVVPHRTHRAAASLCIASTCTEVATIMSKSARTTFRCPAVNLKCPKVVVRMGHVVDSHHRTLDFDRFCSHLFRFF
jgi:hypothetical protein